MNGLRVCTLLRVPYKYNCCSSSALVPLKKCKEQEKQLALCKYSQRRQVSWDELKGHSKSSLKKDPIQIRVSTRNIAYPFSLKMLSTLLSYSKMLCLYHKQDLTRCLEAIYSVHFSTQHALCQTISKPGGICTVPKQKMTNYSKSYLVSFYHILY